jgi:FAD/FMN-containing dehydrogenase
MSLVPLISPDSEAEVLTLVALLEAYGVPVHVRGGGFGGLYPGPQEHGFNAKTLMVPEEALEDARRLLDSIPDDPPSA